MEHPVERDGETSGPVPRPGHNLTGLALSGGGIRSAAFCLGVLQGIDGGKPDREPQILDSVDYLSAVSGGNYIATSLVSGTMQAGRFPFASKQDGSETLETQHLRDFSRYLAPAGAIDIVVGLVSLLRGLLINAMIFGSLICLAAAITVLLNPTEAELRSPGYGLRTSRAFEITALVAAVIAVVQIAYATVTGWPSKWPRLTTLANREAWGRTFAIALIALALLAAFEGQAYVLMGLFDHDYCRSDPNVVARLLSWSDRRLSGLGTGLLSAMAAAAAFATKLSAVVHVTAGDTSVTGRAKRWASLAALALAALIVPVVMWIAYLGLSYGGIAPDIAAATSDTCPRLAGPLLSRPHTTPAVAAIGGEQPWIWYLAIGSVAFALSLLVRPNANSLHGYYRDRLSRAFLWKLDELVAEASALKTQAPTLRKKMVRLLLVERPKLLAGRRKAGKPAAERPVDVDEFQFHSLKARGADGIWSKDVRLAPYLLVNTAVNLEGSRLLNRRGRNADAFLLSPLFVGSEATGYAATLRMEQRDNRVNLATAMAISGAAASANMGASTIKPLTFSMSALNVRLGYWLPNPRRLETRNILAAIGPLYFARETFSRLDEWSQNVYLTDGGHFDNLGLYELLKRRCRIMIAVDAEADPAMTFGSLVRLQRYARIDYGVRIELPWKEIGKCRQAVASGSKAAKPEGCHGPHVAIGRVVYDETTFGILIYVKACLTHDESDLVLDYKRRFSDFPHETTLDQFFGEEQFEVYRTLGFHIASRFLSGVDAVACLPIDTDPAWGDALREALIHVNLAPTAIQQILKPRVA